MDPIISKVIPDNPLVKENLINEVLPPELLHKILSLLDKTNSAKLSNKTWNIVIIGEFKRIEYQAINEILNYFQKNLKDQKVIKELEMLQSKLEDVLTNVSIINLKSSIEAQLVLIAKILLSVPSEELSKLYEVFNKEVDALPIFGCFDIPHKNFQIIQIIIDGFKQLETLDKNPGSDPHNEIRWSLVQGIAPFIDVQTFKFLLKDLKNKENFDKGILKTIARLDEMQEAQKEKSWQILNLLPQKNRLPTEIKFCSQLAEKVSFKFICENSMRLHLENYPIHERSKIANDIYESLCNDLEEAYSKVSAQNNPIKQVLSLDFAKFLLSLDRVDDALKFIKLGYGHQDYDTILTFVILKDIINFVQKPNEFKELVETLRSDDEINSIILQLQDFDNFKTALELVDLIKDGELQDKLRESINSNERYLEQKAYLEELDQF